MGGGVRAALAYNLGIPVCGGSDSPVTPYSPLDGMKAAINHPNEQQRLNLLETLEMFTSTAAFRAFEEKDNCLEVQRV